MNLYSIQLECIVAALGVLVLMIDAFCPKINPRRLGFFVVLSLAAVLAYSFKIDPLAETTWNGMIRADALAMFFRRLCMFATAFGVVVAANDRAILAAGAPAFFGLSLMALSGMMLMTAANDFIMLFVSLELVTVTFYILTSFLRRMRSSLEAGVKYLTLGTLSSSFLLLGIAFLFAAKGSTLFDAIRPPDVALGHQNSAFMFGSMLVMAGLAFKVGSVPFQMWAPDVYQGAPTPTTMLLATGSKAAGFAALLRLFLTGVFPLRDQWAVLVALFALTSLMYGSLGAILQRDLKRLMGYVSIGSAGFLMMGVSAYSTLGLGALLYYMVQDAAALAAIFVVITAIQNDNEVSCSFDSLAGLHRRSPLSALALFLAMMSLAGVPPLSGAIGKFFLFGAVLERAVTDPRYYILAGVGGVAALISLYYCVNVIRAAFVDASPESEGEIPLSRTQRVALFVSIIAIVGLGVCPSPLFSAAMNAIGVIAK